MTLMQFQADMINLDVIRPKIVETTALGAAYLAGLAVGFWENKDEIQKSWDIDRIYQPAMDEDQRKNYIKGWQSSKAWQGMARRLKYKINRKIL